MPASMPTVAQVADFDARRTAPLPPEFAARLDRLIAEHAQLAWAPPTCGVMAP